MTMPLPSPRMRTRDLAEIGRGYVALAALASIAGFIAQDVLARTLFRDAGASAPIEIASSAGETWFILGNNLAFFALVSVLPVVNILMVVVQFLSLGRLAFTVQELPLDAQVNLLYRHTVFEVVALGAAVAISYLALFAIRDYANSEVRDTRGLLRRLGFAARLYVLVLACTVVGALLEGGAVVHL
ncbi:MAG: hypothetical protein KDB60_04110 [Propionibacteriaceae bacterium]|nr:hypothetical protein [Propionibacteriaceae bacterium]